MRKRLIVCSDGTWNSRATGRPTNVEKLAQAIAATAADGTSQIVFYDQGVGTGLGLDRWLGGLLGVGLTKNVEDAYRFLVDNYTDGDDIYLFGFSRGAYTVRSTVGLIHTCGLLRKPQSHRFAEAFAIYRKRDGGAESPEAQAFRARYSSEVRVACLGVWDTVGRLGIPGHLGGTFIGRAINRDFEFHDVRLSSRVPLAAYQALAIDERRAPFAPAVWWREQTPGQIVEQAWFAGTHGDVGGGRLTWQEAGTQGSLADVAFTWMVERAKRHGIEFDEDYLAARIRPNPLAPLHESRAGFYRLLPVHRRVLLSMPRDPALQRLLKRRRQQAPGYDPMRHPTPIDSPQTIHPSVLQRVEADPAYRPANLMQHLGR